MEESAERSWQGKGQGSKEVRSEFIFVQCVLRVYSFSTKNPKFIREFLFNINIKKERERWPYLRKTLGVTRIGRAVKNKRK